MLDPTDNADAEPSVIPTLTPVMQYIADQAQAHHTGYCLHMGYPRQVVVDIRMEDDDYGGQVILSFDGGFRALYRIRALDTDTDDLVLFPTPLSTWRHDDQEGDRLTDDV